MLECLELGPHGPGVHLSIEILGSGVEKGLAKGQQPAWLVWGRCLEDCRGPGTEVCTDYGVLLGGVDMVLTPTPTWANTTQALLSPGYFDVNCELDRV